MSPTVFRILKGHLALSLWLYVFFGLMQLFLLTAYWNLKYQRAPLFGALLGVWGAAAAMNMYSLVWRSVPLAAKDASIVRWWGIAGLPGLFLTIVIGIAWAFHFWTGLTTPPLSTILGCVLASWAVLGAFAAIPRSREWLGQRFRVLKGVFLFVSAAVVLGYGLPMNAAVQPYAFLFISVGLALLVLSAIRAQRATQWRWPEMSTRRSAAADNRGAMPRFFGVKVILVPLFMRSVIFAVVATGTLAILHVLFPRAGWLLFWAYFAGVSVSGILLTYSIRMARQPLRCLPLSVNQLAGLLQLIAVLPGVVTLSMTLLVHFAVLNLSLDNAGIWMIALVLFSSQTLLERESLSSNGEGLPNRTPMRRRMVPILQGLLWPGWIGAMVGFARSPHSSLSWAVWLLVPIGIFMCVFGHFMLLRQLRAGIRPSVDHSYAPSLG